MLTERDIEILRLIARVGAAGAEHVMGGFGVGRSQAHARLGRLCGEGLIARRALLYRRPALYVATRAGLRMCGLSHLGVASVSAAGFEHAWQACSAAVALADARPDWRLLGEREVRGAERERQALLASVRLSGPGGGGWLHRPDLALLAPDGRVLAIEVELSVKAPRRLAAICRAYARARHIEHVFYFASPRVRAALGRALARERAGERITVLALGCFELPAQYTSTEVS